MGRRMWRYWGYLTLLACLVMWLGGSPDVGVLLALSGVTALYFLFRVPAWCGAVTRDETLCRRNSKGLLFGCSYRQHKYQKLRMAFLSRSWRTVNKGLWHGPQQSVATLSALAATVSALAAVASLAVS